ncbi:MAG: lipocalin family protein [Bacteroidaceae bacterium]|nr:lipocalin family protein [Bacteroidaceae bacterium]
MTEKMKKVLFIVVVTLIASLLTGCSTKLTVDNSVVSDLDLNRYLGDWYEIARFDHRFERGVEYTKANYTLREDGKVSVLNTGIKDGKPKEAKGKAKLTDTPALLRVSFFGPFYADYRVMLLAADYQYALIGSGSDKYLWILSRTPRLSDEAKALILNEAQRRGYDTSKLIWVKQE